MNSYRKVCFAILATILLSMLSGVVARAQGPADLTTATPVATADPPASADPLPPSPAPPSSPWTVPGNGWRGAIALNGWFPGVHGTVGALGHEAGFSAPFSDVLHYLKGVIPVTVEADKGRFVMPIDFLWLKLANGKATPFTDLTSNYVNVHLTESILTPLAGYRVMDGDHFKVDVLGGIRYWYLGQNLELIGSNVTVGPFVASANWVDGLGGARFVLPLSEKAAVTISGDAGAGGAKLDYEAMGLFTYNIKPKIGMSVGWRYMYVNYRPSNHQFVFDAAMSGAVLGMYFNFGGKPPIPPSASCSAQPTEVWSGDPVTVTATGANFNPKRTVTYGWTANGGKLSSMNTQSTAIDTAGMAPGSYSAHATITDPKEKKNNSATCTANFSIKQPQPPQVSCSANPTTIAINEPSTITMTATDPQGWPMTNSWTATGGQLSGSGTSATVTATNADAGNTITITGTASDARANLSSSCTAQVNVPPVQKCVNIEDWGECTFEKNPKKPWRVDNDCKDTLDKLSLRLQQMPNGKLNVVGYTDQEEVVSEQTLGSQRSVNVKYYLTTDGPNKADAGRIQPRQGGAKGKATHFYFVPEGTMCGGQLEEGTTVDETQVQPQSRNAPAPKKAKKAASTPHP